MSKASKSKRKIKRAAEKRALKELRRRQYEEFARSGQNSKSVRFRRNVQKKRTVSGDGTHSQCGNVGCVQCFGLVGSPEWKRQKIWQTGSLSRTEKMALLVALHL